MLEINLVSRWEDVRTISHQWNALLADSAADTFFLTWEWISAWWKNYGNGRRLFTLLAKDKGELVGIAPFYIDQLHQYGKRWNALRIIGDGSGDSDYQDCIVRAGLESEVAAAFVEFFVYHRKYWDVIEFESAPEKSPFINAFVEVAAAQLPGIAKESVPCTTITLPSSWEEYLNSLKPRVRSKIRSSLSFLETEIQSVPKACQDVKQLDDWLPILFDLHSRRWQQAGQSGIFGGSAKRNFYADISRTALDMGRLAFYRLDWAERPLALQYGFLYRNRFFLLQEGYDPNFDSVRPGQTLRAWTIRNWIVRGLEVYDFLAGAPKHKLEWGGTTKQSLRIKVTSGALSTWKFIDKPRALELVKSTILPIIPERLQEWRKDFVRERRTRGIKSDQRSGADVRQIFRRVVSRAYSVKPLGALGQAVASAYTLHSIGKRLRVRQEPICQILIYHRVNDDHDPFLGANPVRPFKRHMEFIAANFPIVSLDEIASGAWRSLKEKFCLAVTFDDGYRDNYLNAFPILKRLNIPATVFLTTGSIEEGKLPWYDQVALAFKLTTKKSLQLQISGAPSGLMDTERAQILMMQKTLEWLWGLKTEVRLSHLTDLFPALEVSEAPNLPNFMLNWAEIREMSKNRVTFGGHTVTHPVLSQCTTEAMEKEIVDSKKSIERNLKLPVIHFAYPFGRCGDFDSDTKNILRAAGFKTAVTTIPGYNCVGDDPLELKRFTPWGEDLGLFALQLDFRRVRGFTTQEQNASGLFGRTQWQGQRVSNPVTKARSDVG
jgi:peptidoglycan/xylan/chitin deacetylase (PgdA/CDA1 family)/CelD/BcsL family acetyltransferase involved in cellulose biosynthesis